MALSQEVLDMISFQEGYGRGLGMAGNFKEILNNVVK